MGQILTTEKINKEQVVPFSFFPVVHKTIYATLEEFGFHLEGFNGNDTFPKINVTRYLLYFSFCFSKVAYRESLA